MALEGYSKQVLEVQNKYADQMVKVANTLARRLPKWDAVESKLFLIALAQIERTAIDGTVVLSKKDVLDALGTEGKVTTKTLRSKFERMMKHSFIKLDGETDEDWCDGFLVSGISSTRNMVTVQFTPMYLSLLRAFTDHILAYNRTKLGSLMGMTSQYAIRLYLDLKSHYDPKNTVNHWIYYLEDLKKLFDLSSTDYVYKTGRKKGKFNTTDFRRFTLDVAERQINQVGTGMRIDILPMYSKGGKFLLGYDISFVLEGKDRGIKQGKDSSIVKPTEEYVRNIERRNAKRINKNGQTNSRHY